MKINQKLSGTFNCLYSIPCFVSRDKNRYNSYKKSRCSLNMGRYSPSYIINTIKHFQCIFQSSFYAKGNIYSNDNKIKKHLINNNKTYAGILRKNKGIIKKY